MFELLGQKPERAAAAAKTVMAFETSLAEATMTNVQRRDPYAVYHRMDLAGLAALSPDFDWKPLLRQFHTPESTPINVSQPEFVKKFNRQLSHRTGRRLEDLASLARAEPRRLQPVGAIRPRIFPFLKPRYCAESRSSSARWQTCTAEVDLAMGDALGEALSAKALHAGS